MGTTSRPSATNLSKAAAFLRHPLVIAVLAAAFSALLIPQVTREWQDRQKEQDLKQSLLGEISTSSTSAVRSSISLAGGHLRAAGGEQGEDAGDVYQQLRNDWLVRRASARARIAVYFPQLYACWYSFERATADFLSLAVPGDEASRRARVASLQRYVNADFAESYIDPGTKDGCRPLQKLPPVVQARFAQLKDATRWPALESKDARGFGAAYAVLGEELIIGMERVIDTIVATPARGFSHGLFR
jgi:hypothetical protein